MEYVIDMPSSQQQYSSDLMQNNNGDHRSFASTSVGAQEKFVLITAQLEMGASRLGVLVCGWVVLMLVQGGIVVTVETKDRVSITVLFFLVCFRCWRYFYPQDTGSLTEATQSLSADNIQQLALPIGFIRRLFYWWNLVSVMTCVVLSMKRLASQDFSQTEAANKGARDFALNVFYSLTLAEALLLLLALTFATIMAMQRKVTEALIDWVKSSQPAQALPTHQNTTLFEWAKCQSSAKSVGYSHQPESELYGLCRNNEFSQLKPLLSSSARVPQELDIFCEMFHTECVPQELQSPQIPIQRVKIHDLVHDLAQFKLHDLVHDLAQSLANPDLLHDLPHSWADLTVVSRTYTKHVIQRLSGLSLSLANPTVRWTHTKHVIQRLPDLSRTFYLRTLKYIHPSLDCLHLRVSGPPQLLLKKNNSNDSEDNPPHLKAD